MHMRRILLAFSLAASAASVAFADYQNIGQATDGDRLEQLSKTLAQGSYSHPDDIDLPAVSNVSVKLREKTIELNNATIERKYGRSAISSTERTTHKNWKLNVSDYASDSMETTYENYSTYTAPTRAMAGCLLSTWRSDHNW